MTVAIRQVQDDQSPSRDMSRTTAAGDAPTVAQVVAA